MVTAIALPVLRTGEMKMYIFVNFTPKDNAYNFLPFLCQKAKQVKIEKAVYPSPGRN